jgi:hypothetical protein
MSIQDVYDGAQLMCRTLRMLDCAQLTVQVSEDMAEYAEIIRNERPEQPLGAPFDLFQSLRNNKAFWITARDLKGTLVHTQALRLLDLGEQTLADHLRRNFRDYPPAGLPIDFENSAYNPGPGARRITGRALYHGEFWIKENSSFRGRGIVDILSRFAFLSATMHWQPDYLWGLMARHNARRGLAERVGYMHSDPFAVSWKVADRNQPIVGNLVWLAMDDLRYIAHVPLDEASAA